jgi:hypothetical protein
MKPRRLAILLIAVTAVGLAVGLVYQRRQSPRAQQEKRVEQFIAILPDSLSNDHILEIRKMFYVLYDRAALGKVKPETLAAITTELDSHIQRGHITATNLVHFMAEVGYSTYKDEPHYNLSDGTVDNPVLNPQSAPVKLGFDSTQYDSEFWAGYKEFEKAHREDFSDSASGPVR